MIGILLLSGITTLLYYVAIKPYNYWSKKNVKTGKITPLFGDIFKMLLGKENFPDMMVTMYNKVQNIRYIGVYQFQTPVLLIKSPQLIKQILVKDFDHFLNRRNYIIEGVDELFAKNLSSLRGESWRNMRSKLSPSFSSTKMRTMFGFICHNANIFVQHFLRETGEIIELDLRDAYSRYSNDVIASVAFGVEINSLVDKQNTFYTTGKEFANITSVWLKFRILLIQWCPNIASIFGIKLVSDRVKNYFMNIVKDTIRIRKQMNIKRSDMLGLLIERNDENSMKLTDADIASQLFVFFIAGFESVSLAMCFLSHELATYPKIQRKLIEEIDGNRPKDSAPSYETVMNLTYLDMVVSELFRKWPMGLLAERLVTKPYTIQPELPGEQPVHLDVDDSVLVPIYAIHRDPQHYPDPEKFDPERFSPENKQSMDPYAYLPFGAGPRNCIGSRFGQMEIKAIFFYLLSHFEFVPTDRTSVPLKISKTAFAMIPENGFHIALKKRGK